MESEAQRTSPNEKTQPNLPAKDEEKTQPNDEDEYEEIHPSDADMTQPYDADLEEPLRLRDIDRQLSSRLVATRSSADEEKRFFGSEHYTRKIQASPTALLESWNQFVKDMEHCADAVVALIAKHKERFYKHNVEGMKMKVHEMSMEEMLPCAVLRGVSCPMCYSDSKRLPSGLRLNENGRVPTNLIEAIYELDQKVTSVERTNREAEVQRSLLDDSYMEGFGVTQDDFLRVATYSTCALREVQALKTQQAALLKKFEILQSGGDNMQGQLQGMNDHTLLDASFQNDKENPMNHGMQLSDDLFDNPIFNFTLDADVEHVILFVNLYLTIEANRRELCRFSRGDKDVGAEFAVLQKEMFRIDKQSRTTFECIGTLLDMAESGKFQSPRDKAEFKEKINRLQARRAELAWLKRDATDKARAVFKEYKAVLELENKIIRNHERESKRDRKWKDIVREQWDPSRYREMFLKISGGRAGDLVIEPFRAIWGGKR
ncbi:hypothetical protein PHYBOEH_006484 [Phytophthora boehmeriae]|uniref:Uncharacterized protein n=1 Tax=Phytophthora boehmeriae TaxID=109152 RepID=A0A8T1WJD3_9STRA|nr:hypothetical protein PHYBOEH_006484 [Phytophthora boehmeriae]